MIIGIISDTHDKLEPLERALDAFAASGVELILHGGDWTKPETVLALAEGAAARGLAWTGVLGNNDERAREEILAAGQGKIIPEPVLSIETGGIRLAVHHGHMPRVMRELVADSNLELVVRGHSHKSEVTERPGGLLVNPGSTAFAIPRRAGWLPSVAIYDTAAQTAAILELSPGRGEKANEGSN